MAKFTIDQDRYTQDPENELMRLTHAQLTQIAKAFEVPSGIGTNKMNRLDELLAGAYPDEIIEAAIQLGIMDRPTWDGPLPPEFATNYPEWQAIHFPEPESSDPTQKIIGRVLNPQWQHLMRVVPTCQCHFCKKFDGDTESH